MNKKEKPIPYTLTPKAIAYLDAQQVQRPRNDAGKEEMR